MSRKSKSRKSLLDNTRNSNFLRQSYGGSMETDTISLTNYVNKLKTEKEQWKLLLKKKKKLAGTVLKPLVWKEEDGFNLDEVNKQFLNEGPDYTEVVKKANRYLEMLLLNDVLYEEREHIAESLLLKMENERALIYEKLIEDVLCEICNDGICTKDVHTLASRVDEHCPPLSSHFLD